MMVADRGLRQTELVRTCRQLGFHDVIRIEPKFYVECPEFRKKLGSFAVKRGIERLLKYGPCRQQPHSPRIMVRRLELRATRSLAAFLRAL